MTQGIFVDGQRPRSKKQIKEAAASDPKRVRLEATSLFAGTEFNGPLVDAPKGQYNFVGPDPYTDRKFYGNIIVDINGKITVK